MTIPKNYAPIMAPKSAHGAALSMYVNATERPLKARLKAPIATAHKAAAFSEKEIEAKKAAYLAAIAFAAKETERQAQKDALEAAKTAKTAPKKAKRARSATTSNHKRAVKSANTLDLDKYVIGPKIRTSKGTVRQVSLTAKQMREMGYKFEYATNDFIYMTNGAITYAISK